MMLNDTQGDCTCAGFFHAVQVWTFNTTGEMVTAPDSSVEGLYQRACGYVPGDENTDRGGVEQDVLTYLLNTGTAISPGDPAPNKLTAFYEVDPRNLDDVRRTIADCGVAYIGLNMPVYILQNPTKIWDEPGTGDDTTIEGGHCVIQPAYDIADSIFKHISWGMILQMTEGFFLRSTDEVYGPVDADWINQIGTTPLGLSLGELEAQMAAIKQA